MVTLPVAGHHKRRGLFVVKWATGLISRGTGRFKFDRRADDVDDVIGGQHVRYDLLGILQRVFALLHCLLNEKKGVSQTAFVGLFATPVTS
jgi:hypothetical protein